MGWTVTGDLDAFVGAAGDFLRALPEEHSVMLTIMDMLRRRGPRFYGDDAPRFGRWRDGAGLVRSALLHTPPRMVRAGALPREAAGSLAGLLAGSPPTGAELPGVAAAASRRALDAGAERVLITTDLAHPTSNSVYRRIGFRPALDRVALRLAG